MLPSTNINNSANRLLLLCAWEHFLENGISQLSLDKPLWFELENRKQALLGAKNGFFCRYYNVSHQSEITKLLSFLADTDTKDILSALHKKSSDEEKTIVGLENYLKGEGIVPQIWHLFVAMPHYQLPRLAFLSMEELCHSSIISQSQLLDAELPPSWLQCLIMAGSLLLITLDLATVKWMITSQHHLLSLVNSFVNVDKIIQFGQFMEIQETTTINFVLPLVTHLISAAIFITLPLLFISPNLAVITALIVSYVMTTLCQILSNGLITKIAPQSEEIRHGATFCNTILRTTASIVSSALVRKINPHKFFSISQNVGDNKIGFPSSDSVKSPALAHELFESCMESPALTTRFVEPLTNNSCPSFT